MMTPRLVLRGLAALAVIALAVASCSDKGLLSTDTQFARVMFVPAPTELDDGASARIAVVGVQVGGRQITLAESRYAFQWTSSDPNVLRIDGTGNSVMIQAVAPGRANLSVDVTPLSAGVQTAPIGSLRASSEVVATPVPTDFTLASPNNLSGLAGAMLPDSVTVRVVDRRGTGVGGVRVSFEVLEGRGTVSNATTATDTAGFARTAWRLGDAGTNRIRGRSGKPDKHVDVNADGQTAVPAAITVAAGNAQQGVVGSILPNRPSVRVTDAAGTPLPGVSVTWTVLTGGGSIAPQVAPTDDQGISAVYWTLGTVAGPQTARATTGSLSANFSATARAAAPARLVKLGGDGQSAVVSTRLTDSLAVQVVDQYGNVVSGAVVNWSVQLGGGSVSPAAATTGASGIVRTAWTMGAGAGSASTKAAVTGTPDAVFSATALAGGSPPPPPPANTIVKLSGDGQSAAIATRLTDSVAVRVQNAQGTGVAGVGITWAVTSGGGSVSPQSGVTNSNGVASAAWTMGPSAGSASLKASTTSAGEVNFTATATASTGGSSQLTITKMSGDAQTGTVSTRLADSLVVQVKDAQGVGVAGVSIGWSVQSGNGSVSPASFTTNGSGFARTAWTLGSNTGAGSVQASAPNATAVTFTSTANAPIVAQVVITPAADTIEALNAQVTLAATARDASGQPVPGTRFAWSSLNPATATVDTMGKVTGQAVGSALIVASAVCCGRADTTAVTVLQRVFGVQVSLSPTSLTVGDSARATVTVTDSLGSPITGRPVTWSSLAPAVATVSSTGMVRGVTAGNATVRAAVDGRSDDQAVTITSAPPPPAASGDTIFYDGFESGNLNAWQDGYNPSVHQVLTNASLAVSGSRLLEMTIPAGSQGNYLARFFMPGYDSIHVRMYLRYAPNWTGNTYLALVRGSRADNQWSSFGAGGQCPNGTEWFATNVTTAGTGSPGTTTFYTYWFGMPKEPDNVTCWGRYGNGNEVYYNQPSMSRDQWHRVEFWVKLNTPGQLNSVQKIWVDGQLRGEWAGINFRTTTNLKLNSLTISAYADGVTGAARQLYYDEILITTAPGGGGSPPPPPPPPTPVATVTVSPSAPSVNVGSTQQLTATTRDAGGVVLTGRTITWASGNTSVASVNASGVVTGNAAGTATITATSEGQSGTASVTVTQPSGGTYAPPDLASNNFEAGALAPYTSPYNVVASDIIPDPTGNGFGKVLKIHYHIGATVEHADDNKSIQFTPVNKNMPVLFMRWYVYVPDPVTQQLRDIQRKLIYVNATNTQWHMTFGSLGGSSVPNVGGLLLTNWVGGGVNHTINAYNLAPLRYNQWHYIEIEVRLNTPGLSDGVVRVWFDDANTPVYQNTAANVRGAYSTGFEWILIGQQADRVGFFVVDEDRYLDRIAFSTKRIGPQ